MTSFEGKYEDMLERNISCQERQTLILQSLVEANKIQNETLGLHTGKFYSVLKSIEGLVAVIKDDRLDERKSYRDDVQAYRAGLTKLILLLIAILLFIAGIKELPNLL